MKTPPYFSIDRYRLKFRFQTVFVQKVCILYKVYATRNERIVTPNVRNTDAVCACVSYNEGDHALCVVSLSNGQLTGYY